MSETTTALGIVGDISVVIIIGVSSILMRQLATPFHRGFFKDDESLMYPLKDSTVPVTLLYGVGFTLPSLAIMVIEWAWLWLQQRRGGNYGIDCGTIVRRWAWNAYRVGLMFFFGVAVTHFSTNVPKYAIGRLRPHFFAACVPDLSQASSLTYLEHVNCTGNDPSRIKEARLSFPSGHSSMAIYCALFLMLYLQRRFTWQGMVLLKPLLQTLWMLMGIYTCLSRVSDYKHHWSDVLAGGLLGALVAVYVFWSLQKNILAPLDCSNKMEIVDHEMLVQTLKLSKAEPANTDRTDEACFPTAHTRVTTESSKM